MHSFFFLIDNSDINFNTNLVQIKINILKDYFSLGCEVVQIRFVGTAGVTKKRLMGVVYSTLRIQSDNPISSCLSQRPSTENILEPAKNVTFCLPQSSFIPQSRGSQPFDSRHPQSFSKNPEASQALQTTSILFIIA